MRTFRILGLMISYPTAELVENMDAAYDLLKAEGVLSPKALKGVKKLMDHFHETDLMDLQEDYVGLFDRSRHHSLYLFEHIHGESRDRGMAMVNLREHYASHGLELSQKELPDYIPMFLEFLSMQDFKEAQTLLNETVHIMAAVGAKLGKKDSHYAEIFKALEAVASVKPDAKFVEAALSIPEDESLEALDQDWVEPEAFDGLGGADCGTCSESLQRMTNTINDDVNTRRTI